MKKFMKKGLAAILAMTVMFTAAPIQTVWAQDVSAEQTQVENNATDDASDNVETQATQSQIDSTLLQYVVVDQATINSPDTQNIVIGFEDNVSYVKQAVLKITNMDSGEEYEITASEITESAMKFSIDYMDSTVSGKFKVTSVTISDDNSSKTILLSDAGIDAVYSVNSEIETNPDAYVVDSDDDPDLTVENVDQDGNVESADSLEDALNVAQEENADQASSDDYGIDLYSASSSNVVVVLDPGHGGSDPGTTYTVNGTYLCERDINLKIAQYCKAELEKYLGVTVYMTRSDNTSPNTDREQRARFAKEHGAHVLVSIHINSSSNREAHGAILSKCQLQCKYQQLGEGYWKFDFKSNFQFRTYKSRNKSKKFNRWRNLSRWIDS